MIRIISHRIVLFLIFLATISFAITGCGKPPKFPGVVPGEGKITLNGTPLDGANIIFYPKDTTKASSLCRSGQDGSFVLQVQGQEPGIYPGEFTVVVTKSVIVRMPTEAENAKYMREFGSPAPPEYGLGTPEKYSEVRTSDLLVEIPEKGKKDILLELKK